MPDMSQAPARFDDTASAVVIDHLTVRDADLVREAQRWTTGARGPRITDTEQLARAVVTSYVTEALRIGTHALSVTGQAQDPCAVEQLLKDLADCVEWADCDCQF